MSVSTTHECVVELHSKINSFELFLNRPWKRGRTPNVEVTVDTLPLGNVLINDCILIERKRCTESPTDFEASILDADKRLFNQSTKMTHEDGVLCIFLIEGDVYGNSQRMPQIQNIDGALTYLAAVQRLSVLTSYSLTHSMYLMLKLASHHRSGLFNPVNMRANKPKSVRPAMQYVLEGFPGINTTIAEAALDHFGSVRGFANASLEELQQVPKIGKAKAQKIFAVLNGE